MERELAPGIVTNPEILGGRPILKGHRIAVSQLLGQLSGGMTVEEVREDYALTEAEMLAVLRYATQAVEEIRARFDACLIRLRSC